MNLQEIFSLKHLIKAHHKARLDKRWKKDVCAFDVDRAYELAEIENDFLYGRYKMAPYRSFFVYEPKKRRIDATNYRDRVVQTCFVDSYLMPLVRHKLIYDNAACQKKKGTDFARGRLIWFFKEAYERYGDDFYVLTYDIHHFFESIDHAILKEKMRAIIEEDDVYDFVERMIDGYSSSSGKGLPLGNQSSQCFALYYLNDMDHMIKEKYGIEWYSRYMDDGVIFCKDRKRLVSLLEEMKIELAKLKLELNVKKTNIFHVKQGVTYLGFTYHLTKDGYLHRRMAKKKRARLIKCLKSYDLCYESLLTYYYYVKFNSDDLKLLRLITPLLKAKAPPVVLEIFSRCGELPMKEGAFGPIKLSDYSTWIRAGGLSWIKKYKMRKELGQGQPSGHCPKPFPQRGCP